MLFWPSFVLNILEDSCPIMKEMAQIFLQI